MVKKLRRPKPKAKSESSDQRVRSHLSSFLGSKQKKPQPTKNRYKFESFSQRLSKIDVKGVGYRDFMELKFNLESETSSSLEESCFLEFLENERVRNNSLEFAHLVHGLRPFTGSFVIIFHNHANIITTLLEHYQTPGLKLTVIEALISLIKDCRSQIYSVFLQKILPRLIEDISISELKLLDKIFTLLAYAFKFLSTQIANTLSDFYYLIFQLITHSNETIRRFTAQALSCFLRSQSFSPDQVVRTILAPLFDPSKYLNAHTCQPLAQQNLLRLLGDSAMRNTEWSLDCLFNQVRIKDCSILVRDKECVCSGLSLIFSEMLVNVQGVLHSQAFLFLDSLFAHLFAYQGNVELLVLFRILRKIILHLWKKVQNTDQILQFLIKTLYSKQSLKTIFLVILFKDTLQLKNGSLLCEKGTQLMAKLITKIQQMSDNALVLRNLVELQALLWVRKFDYFNQALFQEPKTYFLNRMSFSPTNLVWFFQILLYPEVVWKNDISYSKKSQTSELTFQPVYQKKVLQRLLPGFLTAINSFQNPQIGEASHELLLSLQATLNISHQLPLSEYSIKALFTNLSSKDWKLRLFGSALLSYCYLQGSETKMLEGLLEQSLNQCESSSFLSRYSCLFFLDSHQFNFSEISLLQAGNLAVILDKLTQSELVNHNLLRSPRYLEYLLQNNKIIPPLDHLLLNMSSNSHQIRLYSLKLFVKHFAQKPFTGVIRKLIAIEEYEISAQSDKLMKSKFLAVDSSLSGCSLEQKTVIFHCMLGFLWIKLDSIYQDIKTILVKLINESQDLFTTLLDITVQIQKIQMIHSSDHQCVMNCVPDQAKFRLEDPLSKATFNRAFRFQSQNLQFRCNSFYQCFQSLIKVLCNTDNFSSQLSSQFLNNFFLFLEQDYSRFYQIPQPVQELPEEELEESMKSRANTKLQWYLRALLNIKTPQETSYLREFLISIIKQKDEAIQSLAIKCLIMHFYPHLQKYQSSLLNFASSDKLKDEVIEFKFEDKPQDVCNLVVAVLYQKITQGKVRGADKSPEVTKKIIFRFISGLDQIYIAKFIDIWSESVGSLVQLKPRVLIGFLNSTGLMIDKVGKILAPQAHKIGHILLEVQKHALHLTEKSAQNKQIRRLVTGRCLDFISQFVGVSDYVDDEFNIELFKTMRDAFALLSTLYNKSDSSLLRIIALWSEHSPYLLEIQEHLIFRNVLLLLKQSTTVEPVLLKALKILNNLVMPCPQLFKVHDVQLLQILKKMLDSHTIKSQQYLDLLFDLLSELSRQPEFQAPQLIQVIMPIFMEKLSSCEEFSTILDTLQHLLEKEERASRLIHFPKLADQLLVIQGLEFREPYSQFLNWVFSFIDPDILSAIEGTNRSQRGVADTDIDSELFINSVSSIAITESTSLTAVSGLFNSMLYSLQYEDIAVNQVALETISQIIQVAACQAKTDAKYLEFVVEVISKTNRYFCKHYGCQFVLRGSLFILETLLSALESLDAQKLRSFLSLRCLKGREDDSVLKALQSIQIVSRINALKAIQRQISEIEPKQIVSWIVPILRSLFAQQLSKKKALSSKKESQDAHLLKQILNTYKTSVSKMAQSDLFSMMRSISLKIKQEEESKPHCKLLCALVEGIPESAKSSFSEKLKSSIVPTLYSQLKGGQNPYIKYYVVIAIYEIISRIKDKSQSSMHLSRLMHLVSSALTSKDEAVRDQVRDTIVQLAMVLSSSQLHLLFQSLSFTLVKGFQRHVLNFTVHRILKALTNQDIKARALDSSIPYILPGVKDELFGSLREEKESQESQAAKLYKEARAGLAQETLAILAQHVSFKENALTLIRPLQEILSSTSTKRVVNRSNDAFQAIVSGFSKNESLIEEDALLFIYGIVQKSHQIEQRVRSQSSNAVKSTWEGQKKTLKQLEADKLEIQEGGSNERRLTLIRESRSPADYISSMQILESFALNLFYSLTQKKKIQLEEKGKPFVNLILKCCKSQNQKVAMNAYKLVIPFLKRKLISEEITKLVHDSLDTLNRLDSRHNKEMLALIMKVINLSLANMSPPLSPQVINDILDTVAYNIEFSQSVYSLFDALDFIVSQIYISAKVYDLLEIVGCKMVQSYDTKTRQKCSDIYLKFMLTYPLQESRLTQHIHFMLKNLNYARLEGRLQVLDNLKRFLESFPQKVVLPRIQSIFIFLALRFANQEVESVRELIQTTLDLVVNLSDNSAKLLDTVLVWLGQENTAKLAFDLLYALHLNRSVQLFFKKNFDKLTECCESQISSLFTEETQIEVAAASCLRLETKLFLILKSESKTYLKQGNKLELLNRVFEQIDDFAVLMSALQLQWIVLQRVVIQEEQIKNLIHSTTLLFNCKFQHTQFSSQLVTNLAYVMEQIMDRGLEDQYFGVLFQEIDRIYSVIFQTEQSARIQAPALFRFINQFIQLILKKKSELIDSWTKQFLKLAYRLLSDEHYEGSELYSSAETVLEKLKTGSSKFSKALVQARKEVEQVRKERRQESSQMKLNKPEKATIKRIKKQERKKQKMKDKHLKARLMK